MTKFQEWVRYISQKMDQNEKKLKMLEDSGPAQEIEFWN